MANIDNIQKALGVTVYKKLEKSGKEQLRSKYGSKMSDADVKACAYMDFKQLATNKPIKQTAKRIVYFDQEGICHVDNNHSKFEIVNESNLFNPRDIFCSCVWQKVLKNIKEGTTMAEVIESYFNTEVYRECVKYTPVYYELKDKIVSVIPPLVEYKTAPNGKKKEFVSVHIGINFPKKQMTQQQFINTVKQYSKELLTVAKACVSESREFKAFHIPAESLKIKNYRLRSDYVLEFTLC